MSFSMNDAEGIFLVADGNNPVVMRILITSAPIHALIFENSIMPIKWTTVVIVDVTNFFAYTIATVRYSGHRRCQKK